MKFNDEEVKKPEILTVFDLVDINLDQRINLLGVKQYLNRRRFIKIAFGATIASLPLFSFLGCGGGGGANDNTNPALPGVLQFSSATYSVDENGGSALITVTRTGGSSGAVGVSYATSNGTATAGSDYTATSGPLSWANGETASKTFSVPILTDSPSEPNETVNLTLSSATGGATLGSQNTAVLTIGDVPPILTGVLKIEGVHPANNSTTTNCNKLILILFDRLVDHNSVISTIDITPTTSSLYYMWDDYYRDKEKKDLLVLWESKGQYLLAPNTNYSITVKGTAKDMNGNFLDGNNNGIGGDDFKLSFKTGGTSNLNTCYAQGFHSTQCSCQSYTPCACEGYKPPCSCESYTPCSCVSACSCAGHVCQACPLYRI